MLLMSLIKSSSVISLLFPPGHASQFLCFVCSLQILSKDGGPAAIALERGRLAATQGFSHLIGFFHSASKADVRFETNRGKSRKKILFHHAFRPFKAHMHPLKNVTLNKHTVHTRIIHVLFAGW